MLSRHNLFCLLTALLLPATATAAHQPGHEIEGRFLVQRQPLVVCADGDPDACSIGVAEGWIELRSGRGENLLRHFEITDSEVVVTGGPEGGEVELDFAVPYSLIESDDRYRFTLHTRRTADGPIATIDVYEFNFRLSGTYRRQPGGATYEFTLSLTWPETEMPTRLVGSDAEWAEIEWIFQLDVTWRDGRGNSGRGVPIVENDRSARFWFFRPGNPELQVKIVPACEAFGRYWVFVAGLTDLEVEVRVAGPSHSDLRQPPPTADSTRVYTSPLGEAFRPILDTEGFPCR